MLPGFFPVAYASGAAYNGVEKGRMTMVSEGIYERARAIWESYAPSANDVAECQRRALPAGWSVIQYSQDGGAYQNKSLGLWVVSTVLKYDDGKTWQHVSVSRMRRIPSYEDVALAKRIFIGAEKKAIQVFPPQAQHVNIHPYVLHLWHCVDGDTLPDFTHGSGSL